MEKADLEKHYLLPHKPGFPDDVSYSKNYIPNYTQSNSASHQSPNYVHCSEISHNILKPFGTVQVIFSIYSKIRLKGTPRDLRKMFVIATVCYN